MSKQRKILIVGGGDIIESSLTKHFQLKGNCEVFSSTAIGLDPTIQPSVYNFFQKERPEFVILGSVRSGGIAANQASPGDFIYHNLEAQNNIVYAAHKFNVEKLLYIAASCIYPKDAKQPIAETSLGQGSLESTSEAYALAKWAGVKLVQAYRQQHGLKAICCVPATVYGAQEIKDLEQAHVIGALIGKFVNAVKNNEKEVVVWGTGEPRREFIFESDFAAAVEFLIDQYDSPELINVGVGEDISINELVDLIMQETGFSGAITRDTTKKDGAMQKLLDSSAIFKLGWKPKVALEKGIKQVCNQLLERSAV